VPETSEIPQRPLRVGLIGRGAVGEEVLALVERGAAGPAEIVAVLVRDVQRHQAETDVPVVGTVEELLESRPDVVVEAAGHEGLRQHAESILAAGVDMLTLAVGALADEALRASLKRAAEGSGAQLRVCSGAIAGLDAISSAAIIGLDSVTHTVRKPPRALLAPEEARQLIENRASRELYHGPAREATYRFPENVNVVAAVSLAGIGLDRTQVRVIADSAAERNIHEVSVRGHFGLLDIRLENIPSVNPKTGRLVAPSVVRALRRYREPLVIGG
jgi:aspartate dehydrogenase